MKVWALILASGEGKRAAASLPKQFVKIGDRTPVERCLDVFQSHPRIDSIVLVIHPDFADWAAELVARNEFGKIERIVPGGKTRQESSGIGVLSVEDGEEESLILIHDAVRPFVSRGLIDGCLEGLNIHDAVIPALPVSETLVTVDRNGKILTVPERSQLLRVQTPQGFRSSIIKKAHLLAGGKGDSDFTDDGGMVQSFRLASIQTIPGDPQNIKITYPEDFWLAERLSGK